LRAGASATWGWWRTHTARGSAAGAGAGWGWWPKLTPASNSLATSDPPAAPAPVFVAEGDTASSASVQRPYRSSVLVSLNVQRNSEK
jgi:hypothetical protein